LNCRHCRANAGLAGDNQQLTTEQCRRILASIAGFNKSVVILTGGEPTERDDICELTAYGRSLGLRMVMATCGYSIDDGALKKLKDAGIMALSISLDGASAQTHDEFRQAEGAFTAAVEAARAAGRAGMRFQINTTITRRNLAEVAAIADLAEQLGAYCFNPFILVPTGRGRTIAGEILEPAEYEKALRNLLKLKLNSAIEVRVTCGPQFARLYREAGSAGEAHKVSGCMGGRGFGFISYKGDVQTCGFLDISAGNLIENGFDFEKIWLDSRFLNEIRDPAAYKGKCGGCGYVNICGGCRARAYTMTGDYLAEDPLCFYKDGDRP